MGVRDERIAVVGSGVSGLATAWLLQYHGAAVTLFESEERCGGHTLTDHSSGTPVDLGFQVFNLTTYPHFVSWLEHLGVDSEASDMSFAISVDGGKLEWASHGLGTIFAQRENMFNLQFLRMVREVLRFGREAPKVLLDENQQKYRSVTLGQYLQSHGYGEYFRNNYVVPMCAAVWSVPYTQAEKFPVQMLVRFWVNHHLLDVLQRPLWRVVKNRSETYIKAVLSCVHSVRTSTPVNSVTVQQGPGEQEHSGQNKAVVEHAGGREEFDRVVLATHSDIALRLRGTDAFAAETDILAAIPYADNDVYLHRDKEYMPRTPACWASWNVIASSEKESHDAAVCVSYGLHRLQHLPDSCRDLFVTLNPPQAPRADSIVGRMSLAHPVFSMASWEAQQAIPDIQGSGGGVVYYAGAWCGYGFHEDGMRAAVAAVSAMGLNAPWEPRATSPKMTLYQGYVCARLEQYLAAAISTGSVLRVVRPDGVDVTFGASAAPAVHTYEVVPTFTPPRAFEMGSTATERAALGAPLEAAAAGAGCVRLREAHRAVTLAATVRVLDVAAMAQVVRAGSVGMLQGYVARQWEVSDVGALAMVLMLNLAGCGQAKARLGPLHALGCMSLLAKHVHEGRSVDAAYIATELLIDEVGALLCRAGVRKGNVLGYPLLLHAASAV